MIVKFLHWNILFKEKIENISSLLLEINPDVFCLNELSSGLGFNNNIDTAAFIAQKLGFNYYAKEYMDWKGDGSQLVTSGIFSRFVITKKQSIYTKKISFDKSTGIKKGSVYVAVVLEIKNRQLTVATDHMTYVSGQKESVDKMREADDLIKIIEYKKENFIFSGDLNVSPNSYTIKQISKYLSSCGPSYKEKSAFTKEIVDYAGWKTGFDWRLDYVFATPDVKVKSAKIIKTSYSDHLPILVEFEI